MMTAMVRVLPMTRMETKQFASMVVVVQNAAEGRSAEGEVRRGRRRTEARRWWQIFKMAVAGLACLPTSKAVTT